MVLITEFLGYFSALCIGLIFGLIGAGGSILAVPVFAYLFGYDEKTATAYSLFVVGSTAVVGAFRQHIKQYVHWKLVFGLPAVIAVSLTRRFLIPALPEIVFQWEQIFLSRRMFIFGLFAALMIPTAMHMLRSSKQLVATTGKNLNIPLIFVQGSFIGGLTGLVGVGGGFLIIPALIYLTGIDMKSVVGTSMAIIAFNALIGFFLGDAMTLTVEWSFLTGFTAVALGGLLIGIYLSNFVNALRLKMVFGCFVVLMACFIFIMEFVLV